MLHSKTVYLAVLAAFFISCSTSKKTTQPEDMGDMQHVTLDTMSIFAGDQQTPDDSLYPYRPAEDRTWDLQHTILDLSFDWKKELVMGKATLTLTPLFYDQNTVHLDAIQFAIQYVKADGQTISNVQNTGDEILIPLPETYRKGRQLTLEIQYSVHPVASETKPDAAITSDKGLFFIDPQDTIPGLPRQIWTQGETSNARRWYPTIDQPNERGTQEILLTVEDSMMTLSNGILVSSTPMPNGMRKDHWKMDLPHAPYLAMIAVGKWDRVTDYWRGRALDYYVDPGYGPSARAIFANTPEMLEFFSQKLGYEYVWPKLSQIIVKQFVSGAMENTTAIVFGDYIQFDKDDVLEDGTNDYIVAHEMFHHWFGDLVTCESWANVTLNEGFANYAEYLWQEHKYDRERADISRMNELSGYFDQAAHQTHPLINYHYADEDAMFDAHSYNKGGLVLHMLRDLVGDDAFFASLQYYLKAHAFSSAEIDDLRQAFESVTGLDLKWFFDQWYLDRGHPVLDVHHEYDADQHKLSVDFKQTQSSLGFRKVFRLPMEIGIIRQDSTLEIQKVVLDEQSQLFSFIMPEAPLAVVVDPRDILLAVINHDVPESEYPILVVSRQLAISHRLSAVRMLADLEPPMLDLLMNDTSYIIRAMLINFLSEKQETEKLYQLSLQEHHPEMQYFILQALAETDSLKAKELGLKLLANTDKAPIIYTALKSVAAVDLDEALHQLSHFQANTSDAVFAARTSIYAEKGRILTYDDFTTTQAATIGDDYLEELIGAFARYLSDEASTVQDKGLSLIASDFFLRTPNPEYRRFYIITGLLQQYSREEDTVFQQLIVDTIKKVYEGEKDEYLRGILKEGLGDLLN